MAGSVNASTDAVRDAVRRVTDPELDRSIVDLDYVIECRVEGDHAHLSLRLPTAWCSPAFAWMMAADARREALSVPGVHSARVELLDHMHAGEITDGVNDDLEFVEAFAEAEGGLDELRRELLEKARLARQYDAVRALRESGMDDADLVSLTSDDVEFDGDRALVPVDGAVVVCTEREPIELYLDRAERVGLLERGEPIFRDHAGEPIRVEEFETVYRRTRLARTNIGGQAAICAGLHESRQATVGRRY
ncbi:iron-sulfur cluster assembly protein [Natronorarus salvus]|uniref:iron-sulfur cluster assembly protein n=1 Tax=Natronorarus salvus TaxID=3117733 RepID=UPI002F263315